MKKCALDQFWKGQKAMSGLEIEKGVFMIEKGVPVEETGGGRRMKYPFAEMEIGDSFFVPKPPSSLRQTVKDGGKRIGRTFVCGNAIKDGVKGMRIWRTA